MACYSLHQFSHTGNTANSLTTLYYLHPQANIHTKHTKNTTENSFEWNEKVSYTLWGTLKKMEHDFMNTSVSSHILWFVHRFLCHYEWMDTFRPKTILKGVQSTIHQQLKNRCITPSHGWIATFLTPRGWMNSQQGLWLKLNWYWVNVWAIRLRIFWG